MNKSCLRMTRPVGLGSGAQADDEPPSNRHRHRRNRSVAVVARAYEQSGDHQGKRQRHCQMRFNRSPRRTILDRVQQRFRCSALSQSLVGLVAHRRAPSAGDEAAPLYVVESISGCSMQSSSAATPRVRLRPERCIHEVPGRPTARGDRPKWRAGRRVLWQIPDRPPCRQTQSTESPSLLPWTESPCAWHRSAMACD